MSGRPVAEVLRLRNENVGTTQPRFMRTVPKWMLQSTGFSMRRNFAFAASSANRQEFSTSIFCWPVTPSVTPVIGSKQTKFLPGGAKTTATGYFGPYDTVIRRPPFALRC